MPSYKDRIKNCKSRASTIKVCISRNNEQMLTICCASLKNLPKIADQLMNLLDSAGSKELLLYAALSDIKRIKKDSLVMMCVNLMGMHFMLGDYQYEIDLKTQNTLKAEILALSDLLPYLALYHLILLPGLISISQFGALEEGSNAWHETIDKWSEPMDLNDREALMSFKQNFGGLLARLSSYSDEYYGYSRQIMQFLGPVYLDLCYEQLSDYITLASIVSNYDIDEAMCIYCSQICHQLGFTLSCYSFKECNKNYANINTLINYNLNYIIMRMYSWRKEILDCEFLNVAKLMDYLDELLTPVGVQHNFKQLVTQVTISDEYEMAFFRVKNAEEAYHHGLFLLNLATMCGLCKEKCVKMPDRLSECDVDKILGYARELFRTSLALCPRNTHELVVKNIDHLSNSVIAINTVPYRTVYCLIGIAEVEAAFGNIEHAILQLKLAVNEIKEMEKNGLDNEHLLRLQVNCLWLNCLYVLRKSDQQYDPYSTKEDIELIREFKANLDDLQSLKEHGWNSIGSTLFTWLQKQEDVQALIRNIPGFDEPESTLLLTEDINNTGINVGATQTINERNISI